MDIWEKMYEEAQKLYNPHEVSDFVYANHVVAAVEAEDGQIFTGFCMEGTCNGLALFVREGYRTQEEQQEIMDEKIMSIWRRDIRKRKQETLQRNM